MKLLHESTVLPEEIDSLGHMNVVHYIKRVETANQVLMQQLLQPADDKIAQGLLRRTDTYIRFRQEQFEGASLDTIGGNLTIDETSAQNYLEVRNPQNQQVAATFIISCELVDNESGTSLPLSILSDRAEANKTTIPSYAQPRTLDLEPMNREVSAAQLHDAIPNVLDGGMFGGKRTISIEQQDVDDRGWLRNDIEMMLLPFTKILQQSGETHGPPVFDTSDGGRAGWAVLEKRMQVFEQAKLGDQVDYFSAEVSVLANSRVTRRWAFNSSNGHLLGMADIVGVCIDLDARRVIDWPDELRKKLEEYLIPQFA